MKSSGTEDLNVVPLATSTKYAQEVVPATSTRGRRRTTVQCAVYEAEIDCATSEELQCQRQKATVVVLRPSQHGLSCKLGFAVLHVTHDALLIDNCSLLPVSATLCSIDLPVTALRRTPAAEQVLPICLFVCTFLFTVSGRLNEK